MSTIAKDQTQINEKIRSKELRLVGQDGEQIGVKSKQEALEMALSTWGDIKPVVHYSESRSEEQLDESIKPQAHSDLIKELPNTYGHDVDIMVEAKHKELAIEGFIK